MGAELEVESEREATWKEPQREMKALRGRLLFVMEPARLRGCKAMWECAAIISIFISRVLQVHVHEATTVCSGSPEESPR